MFKKIFYRNVLYGGHSARMLVYSLLNREVQQDESVITICSNKLCVNPDHLDIVNTTIWRRALINSSLREHRKSFNRF